MARACNEQEGFADGQRAKQGVWFPLAEQTFVGMRGRAEVARAVQRITVAYAYLRAHEEGERSLIKTYDAALARLRGG